MDEGVVIPASMFQIGFHFVTMGWIFDIGF